MFEAFYEYIKPFLLFAITGLVSAFTPLYGVIYVLNFAFALNIWMGIKADKKVNNKKLHFKFFIVKYLYFQTVSLFFQITHPHSM